MSLGSLGEEHISLTLVLRTLDQAVGPCDRAELVGDVLVTKHIRHSDWVWLDQQGQCSIFHFLSRYVIE